MVQSQLRIKTTGIDHVVLWVNDLERSKRFYTDVLGMTVAHESQSQSFLHCGPTCQIALFDAKSRGVDVTASRELNHMALLMEPASYSETRARLEEEGLTIAGRTGDDTCIYFDDPDGHRIQLLYSGESE